MKKLWKRILAIAMLAVMLLAAVSWDGNIKEPAKTNAPAKTEAPANSGENTKKQDEETKPPKKERDVPFEDKTEDDVVDDNF